ncbi:cytochrome P450 [Nocardia farcinica]|uniref:cytochrome P450 n=1 Tax=Nocardia farcinica TaxID=37329 RepID=UPI001894DCFE|nr:cytochrome P450 [Nocardia farcinica]MBF6359773.1 cytochrome P450 [Nocardia farcinica]
MIGDKRTRLGDDLVTALLSVHDDGHPPSEQELRDILLVTITVGHGTTAHLLENAALALLADAALRADVLGGQRPWPTVIEESLRAQPPTVHIPFRFATDDIELDRGQRIAKGEVIITGRSGVDRRPHIHRNPARFDLRRGITDHLAISNSPRVCLGEPLARLEASIALPALFTRFPDLTLATPPGRHYITSIIDNSHLVLPVFPHPWRW